MTRLEPGDEIWLSTCDWCRRGTSSKDLTETLDGSQVCPGCLSHYDSNFDIVTDDEGLLHA